MTVSLTKVFSAQPGWYCGDFHAHTTCSDGVLSPQELNNLAVEHGLDFLSITDHNDIRAFDHFDEDFERPILPGFELTIRSGHLNVFGFEGNTERMQALFQGMFEMPYLQRFLIGKDHPEVKELLDRIARAGLIMSINHPLCWPWEWRDHETEIACFTAIELVNDPTYRTNSHDNPSARRMWSAWLNAGYRVTALGGTDFHSLAPSDDRSRVSRLNLPLTYVYVRELSCQAILDAVRQRHAYLTMGAKIIYEANLDGQVYMMGDDLGEIGAPVNLYARVEGCASPAKALLIKNGELVVESPVKDGQAEIEWQVLPGDQESGWYRFDVIGQDQFVGHEDQSIAVTNPFFFGPNRPPKRREYGSFLGSFSKF